MKKIKRKKKSYLDRESRVACVRTAVNTGMPMCKIYDYVNLIYETIGIKNSREQYKTFLEMIKNESILENICAKIIEHPNSEEFIRFTLVFMGYDEKVEEVLKKFASLNEPEDKKLIQQLEYDLDALFSELLGDEEIEMITGEMPPDKKPLELINCELETHKFGNGLEVRYIQAPEESFETIRKDFKYAEHLSEIQKITENNDIPDRLLIICSNIYTGLLACKYMSALTDTSNCGPFTEEEDGFSFEYKVPVITNHEIAPLFPGIAGTINLSNYNYQYYQNRNEFQPWWLKPESKKLPIIVIINKSSALPLDFSEKIKILDSHPNVFIIYEKNEVTNSPETELCYEFNNDCVLNEVCFKLNYDAVTVPEPAIDGEYFQRVMVSTAAKEGFGISEEVNKPEILKKLYTFCRGSFEGNSSVVYLIKNAIKRKKDDSRILKNEDFEYLDRTLLSPNKPVEKCRNMEKKSATEKLKTEIYGLDEQKEKALQAVKLLKLRRLRYKAGLKSPDVSPIFLFYGPPGTCKSRFAELMGEIMCEEGLLPGNRMISGSAVSLLKGMYVGHSAPQTKALFENYDIIFLDEIYSIAAEDSKGIDSFSQEILAELCVQLENVAKKCDKLVIMAGYAGNVSEEHNLVQKWLKKNPGIASRITFFISFNPYSPEIEMPEIFNTLARNADVELEEGWREIVVPFFKERMLSDDYGNGREARRLLNNCLLIQSMRIEPNTADLTDLKVITCEDLRKAAQEILKNNAGIKNTEKLRIGFL